MSTELPSTNLDYSAFKGDDFGGDQVSIRPFVNVLQTNSPQVEADGSECKAGDWFHSALEQPLGNTLIFVPVYTDKCFIEWIPRNSSRRVAGNNGFVRRWADNDPIVREAVAAARARTEENKKAGTNKFVQPTLPIEDESDYNDLTETKSVFGYILTDPDQTELALWQFVVISFTKTKLKAYREMNLYIQKQQMKLPGCPPYAHRLKLTTVKEKDPKTGRTYYVVAVGPAVGNNRDASRFAPDSPMLTIGKDFRAKIQEGLIGADYTKTQVEPGPTSEAADDEAF